VISVANGDCDAGFAFDSMVTELLPERGEIEEGEIKIVWESPIIAGSPMAMRNGSAPVAPGRDRRHLREQDQRRLGC
jgi:phosphonate transport system substrate-binding protein